MTCLGLCHEKPWRATPLRQVPVPRGREPDIFGVLWNSTKTWKNFTCKIWPSLCCKPISGNDRLQELKVQTRLSTLSPASLGHSAFSAGCHCQTLISNARHTTNAMTVDAVTDCWFLQSCDSSATGTRPSIALVHGWEKLKQICLSLSQP